MYKIDKLSPVSYNNTSHITPTADFRAKQLSVWFTRSLLLATVASSQMGCMAQGAAAAMPQLCYSGSNLLGRMRSNMRTRDIGWAMVRVQLSIGSCPHCETFYKL